MRELEVLLLAGRYALAFAIIGHPIDAPAAVAMAFVSAVAQLVARQTEPRADLDAAQATWEEEALAAYTDVGSIGSIGVADGNRWNNFNKSITPCPYPDSA